MAVKLTKEFTQLEKSAVKLTVTIEKKEVVDFYNTTVAKYVKNAQIPGFRKGHVPASVLERKYGVHASMPHHLDNKTPEALQSLVDALTGKPLHYEWTAYTLNRPGQADGEVVGGNLSVLCAMLGSNSFPETEGKILFIEEIDEYIYHVERMMYGLKRAGKLDHLKALMIGGLTDIHDNPEPFGKTVEKAIFDVVKDYDYPVCFNFPAGHQPNNKAIYFGKKAKLSISGDGVHFLQLLG